jgi:hypothetical protein
MSEKPASYRSGTAAFELHFGSAFKAILPGAFQGAVVGSLMVATYSTVIYASDGLAVSFSGIAGVMMMFCFIMLVGTLAGMIVCAVQIGLVGLPLALVMRRRIATPAMLAVTLVAATLAGLAASRLLLTEFWGMQDQEALMVAMALAYAIPAGLAYRRAIITERMLGFWSDEGTV